ncbi:unnamed protein product [Urochloa humidicola]
MQRLSGPRAAAPSTRAGESTQPPGCRCSLRLYSPPQPQPQVRPGRLQGQHHAGLACCAAVARCPVRRRSSLTCPPAPVAGAPSALCARTAEALTRASCRSKTPDGPGHHRPGLHASVLQADIQQRSTTSRSHISTPPSLGHLHLKGHSLSSLASKVNPAVGAGAVSQLPRSFCRPLDRSGNEDTESKCRAPYKLRSS